MTLASTGYMVNAFDVSRTTELPPRLRSVVERRARLLGPGYKLFYDEPLEVVRGEGVHVFDAEGRAYLDAYNNVPSVGHCHPHVVQAIARQSAQLNTHTRYVSEGILDYAERLLGTFPDEIERVMFTCTGSEAVDLALRIARHTTGGTGVIVTDNAYHGLTTAVAEISPSMGPNVPIGRDVWVVPAPDRDGVDAAAVGAKLAADVDDAIAQMRRHGVRPAAFVADSIFSTDGIIADPAGFLRPVAEVVHRAGLLYIADEVQPGFARTGAAMWGYQRHGIDADIAVMGKPMGNGMPIAGVAMRANIADRFGNDIRYFNTFGGNTVSIAAAAAVLDVIEQEELLANSAEVGGYLVDRLGQLRDGSPHVRAVRGAGLYATADIVDDSGEPDPVATQVLINGVRRRGVLIGGVGKDASSLKIRPLLPFTKPQVDELVDAVEDALTDLSGN